MKRDSSPSTVAIGHWMLWEDSTLWEQRSAEWHRFCTISLLRSPAFFILLPGPCDAAEILFWEAEEESNFQKIDTIFKERREVEGLTLEPSSAPGWGFHRNWGRSYRATAPAGTPWQHPFLNFILAPLPKDSGTSLPWKSTMSLEAAIL